MAVLLTGGAGYIGTHTAIEVAKSGAAVVIVDNLINSLPEAVKRAEVLAGTKFPFYRADVADEAAMDQIFSEQKIEAVIHFAGLKAVGESVEKPLEYYGNNLGSTLTLLKVMRRHGCRRIVFSSSATVYGTPEAVPITEEMPVGRSCTNPYGWTKVFIEQILRDAACADSKLSVVLLRYFNPIGAHESGRIGENPDGIPNNLMPYISQVAVGRLPRLRVFGNDYPTPDGTGVRDYIHVVDLAKGHVAALAYGKDRVGVETFNLGTGTGYSVLDLVKTFERVNGVAIPYDIVERRAGDIAECYADPSKAKRLLGWQAEKNLEDMCRDTWNWQKNNPEGYPEETV
ncbi:MAG: UDP-glucose 4-epimerase GalE [Lachnospiraceae bacterium]|jgi:UDP-glucose 4-epimerase|nr:UDP-glucose 4-epimerase GalE [Lachnospiraceae bacterium]